MALTSTGELSQIVAHEPQQETYEDGRIEVETDGGENLCEDEPRPPKSEWIISINKNLNRAKQDNNAQSWAKHSIYQIPHYFKDGKEKAYVPQIVSLGPYHHSDKQLSKIEKDKWRSLIEEYLDAVTRVKEQARACYEGTITMSSEEFVMMMVLDGCFVIEMFRGYFHRFDKLGYTHNDPVFSSSQISIDKIRRDMILLENQIPLLILHLLFCLQLIHCVTKLRKKGIKFRKGKVGGFQNIQFKDGTLKIPQLVIEDATRSVFLNLIAFEQYHFNCGNDLISYLIFMDNLINSAEDVGHLHDCGIMEHWLGSDVKVANLFNQLCKEVVFVDSGSYLSKHLSKLSPWSIISLIAAIILLGLTLAQTFYGVFGYYKPGS
ncbi:hypothetical protein EUGRSUZ_L00660 [Eucalyptus grandis]|uniref:Uncharacterized protein n=1 Tax=Eucalyptus grandis TaxID=71139 RepID=A0A058ZUV9_EUCGR|nr:hypothetical protein EUGRSUZ_L00660 [Eucalyptus grandis]